MAPPREQLSSYPELINITAACGIQHIQKYQYFHLCEIKTKLKQKNNQIHIQKQLDR